MENKSHNRGFITQLPLGTSRVNAFTTNLQQIRDMVLI